RNNSYIEVYGVQYTFSELARKTGIDRLTLYARYRKGKRDGDLIAPINENMSHKRKDLTAA
ncbi:hypothetical protein DKZ29_12120, partial [Limosilactobacillus reuteri]